MDVIRNKINAIYPLELADMEVLLSAFQKHLLPKSGIVLRQGDVCENLYYIWRGSVRCYYQKNEKEITEWIAMDDTFFYPPISLFLGQPSRLIVQTIEPTELYTIRHHDLDQLCANSHQIERFYRHLLMNGILAGERRIESLMTSTAHQRYHDLTLKHPDIIKRVPLSYVASYIGVAQETLSRIRGMKPII